jgi:hypothetical protein
MILITIVTGSMDLFQRTCKGEKTYFIGKSLVSVKIFPSKPIQ